MLMPLQLEAFAKKSEDDSDTAIHMIIKEINKRIEAATSPQGRLYEVQAEDVARAHKEYEDPTKAEEIQVVRVALKDAKAKQEGMEVPDRAAEAAGERTGSEARKARAIVLGGQEDRREPGSCLQQHGLRTAPKGQAR
jgi:hypothetical protein